MFYSHEILTSRKHGVATVWLVATLGAKSATKKVTRKAILDVNVRKACETIMEPEAPMALRLQSNLLYGVSRVYSQQCGYVLADVQTAQNGMRALLKIARNNDLDPEAGRARPDQLLLMDDPAFLPDLPLPALDFDVSSLQLDPSADSQRSTHFTLSPHRSSRSGSSPYGASVLGLNLPSSSTNGGVGKYQLPLNDLFAGSSAQKPLGATGRGLFDDEEAMVFQDDMDFEFDADGNVRDIPANERQQRPSGIFPYGRLGSDSAASGRVRREHEEAIGGRVLPLLDGDEDFNVLHYGDEDMHLLPDAVPFPSMTGARRDARMRGSEEATPSSQEFSSSSGAARMKRRKAALPKTLTPDQKLELCNGDLLRWQQEYPDNMLANSLLKIHKKEVAQARKNASAFVSGSGINGVGDGIGSSKLTSPLHMFSGESLLAMLAGDSSTTKSDKAAAKRSRHPDDEGQESPKRARQAGALEEGVGRGVQYDDDGGMVMMMDEDSMGVEMGRDAASGLADHPSSAMPWNISTSLHSHQHVASSSIHGRGLGSQLGGSLSGRRVTSASPLIGRGSNVPGDLERFSMLNDDADYAPILYTGEGEEEGEGERHDDILRRRASRALGISSATTSQAAREEFEIFGAAAAVDTQTAGTSQWVREALDRESKNFLEYVKNTISEKLADELGGGGETHEDDEAVGDFGRPEFGRPRAYVTFEELFAPPQNSTVVAAQAFYHVLSLATKNMIRVEQGGEVGEPFGEVRIGVVESF